ncbi:hypothetical protein SRABI130_04554 [Pseudomonas sp. Bi130]|uniref:hypothetical protein n=1 Tax=Pseudomonas sp. Bi130 TaxID=2821122 RepID=UPI001DE6E67E|nr:hypothetical protein [Pseudomonas sp. Bi130]CAH0297221.1 hypothetical protein SRABI130_04554 [Pseudomonas sp. Bi130]
MQISEAVEVMEELDAARANQRLAEGWKLLAVVPGYDHRQAQSVACYVLGKPAPKEKGFFAAG